MSIDSHGDTPTRVWLASRTRRVLVIVSAITSVNTALVAVIGGYDVQFGGVRVRAHSLRLTLVTAVATGLLAWALAIAAGSGSGRASGFTRWRFAVLVGALVIGLNSIFMLAPPPGPNTQYCVFTRPLSGGFNFILNCDGPEYIFLARTPSGVFTPDHVGRLTRPLSFAIPYVIAAPLRHLGWADWLLEPDGPELMAYAVINLVMLALSAHFVATLLSTNGNGPPGMELFVTTIVLCANEVTKLYFLSPHVQIFNIFVQCLCIYLTTRLLTRGVALSPREALLLGLAFGVGLLIYGTFAIPIISVAAIQLFVYRRPVTAAAIGATAALVFAGWVLFVYLKLGFFYNYEVTSFRQFVWMIDCARLGPAGCVPVVMTKATEFARATIPVVTVPLLLLVAAHYGRRRSAIASAVRRPWRQDPLKRAIALNLLVTTLFVGLMGYYRSRLSWLIVPALLLALALELQALRATLQPRWIGRLNAALFVGACTYIAILTLIVGPFS